MILDLEKVTSDNERISGDEVVGFRDVFGDEKRIDCHIELDVRRVGETYYIHADLTGTLSTACHKCLEPAELRITPSFDLVVQRAGVGPDRESDDIDFVRLPMGENRVSLDDTIREYLVVDIPMQIFCRDDCRGICPSCGVNLNEESCTCAPAPDTRWEALKKLKERD